MASEYAVILKKQMDPLTEELMTKITKEAEVLRERLGQDLITVRDKLEPYADNLKSQDPAESGGAQDGHGSIC